MLGKGEHEGKATETTSIVSRGLLRNKTDKLMVVRGGAEARSLGGADALGAARGAVALKTETIVEPAREVAAEALSQLGWTEPTRPVDGVAERRAEARMKGYVGEACPECANFTLVRNGTCLKCETCGSTTGCFREGGGLCVPGTKVLPR